MVIIMPVIRCPICYLTEQTEWAIPPCGHVFHEECLNKWYKQSKKSQCPTCRKSGKAVRIHLTYAELSASQVNSEEAERLIDVIKEKEASEARMVGNVADLKEQLGVVKSEVDKIHANYLRQKRMFEKKSREADEYLKTIGEMESQLLQLHSLREENARMNKQMRRVFKLAKAFDCQEEELAMHVQYGTDEDMSGYLTSAFQKRNNQLQQDMNNLQAENVKSKKKIISYKERLQDIPRLESELSKERERFAAYKEKMKNLAATSQTQQDQAPSSRKTLDSFNVSIPLPAEPSPIMNWKRTKSSSNFSTNSSIPLNFENESESLYSWKISVPRNRENSMHRGLSVPMKSSAAQKSKQKKKHDDYRHPMLRFNSTGAAPPEKNNTFKREKSSIVSNKRRIKPLPEASEDDDVIVID